MSGDAYFTVVTKSHLAGARVLMHRLRSFDPAAQQYVFLADRVDDYFDPLEENFRIVMLDDYLDVNERTSLTFQYSGFELCNALKAYAHRYINSTTQFTKWSYFDSDILPLSNPHILFAERPDASIYVTPHALSPYPVDLMWLETLFLRFGVLNGGWMAMRRSNDATTFIDWFISRLEHYCFDQYRNTFVDQLWLNFCPLLFGGFHIVRHPGANIGYWNLPTRALEFHDGILMVGQEQALFLHFSGWEIDKPMALSKHCAQLSAPPAWKAMALTYREELVATGYFECQSWPYTWNEYQAGGVIKRPDRRRYADLLLRGVWPHDLNPFDNPQLLRQPFGKRVLKRIINMALNRFL
jgi:hypothetical protein